MLGWSIRRGSPGWKIAIATIRTEPEGAGMLGVRGRPPAVAEASERDVVAVDLEMAMERSEKQCGDFWW